jgi:hypothetical protein
MLTNTYPNFLEVRALPLQAATAVQLVQELIDMNILQHKPGSSSKSNSIFAAIKSRVNRPAPKSQFTARSIGIIFVVVFGRLLEVSQYFSNFAIYSAYNYP